MPIPNQSLFEHRADLEQWANQPESVIIDNTFHLEIKYPKIFEMTREYIKYIPKENNVE